MTPSTFSQGCFVPSLVFEIAARIANSRQVTAADRYMLSKVFLEKSLSEEEHRMIDRTYRAVRLGRIQLVSGNPETCNINNALHGKAAPASSLMRNS